MKQLLLITTLALAACATAPPQAPAPTSAHWPAALADYQQRAGFTVRQNLDLSLANHTARGSLTAAIELLFDPTGKFKGLRWVERSGNPGFDVAVESAVRRSITQLPPLPVPAGTAATLAMPLTLRTLR